ncbi:hypothetical protein [Streptomyces cinereoruber]|uniref:hypothetical protein n=1 Tax=Streptomyces cinereoruber TaxID=67260 RepID=UPI003C2F44F6
MAYRDREQDRKIAAGLAGGGLLVAFLAVASEQRGAIALTVGMLIGAVLFYGRTVEGQPYASWVAWVNSAVIALLTAWALPEIAFIQLPLAGAAAVVAAVLFTLRCLSRGH